MSGPTFAKTPGDALAESRPYQPGAVIDPIGEAVNDADERPFEEQPSDGGIGLGDFYAHMPSHSYLFVPTRDLWPASSVNGRLKPWPKVEGKSIKPSDWLDLRRPVEQLTWHPSEKTLIRNRVMDVAGWVPHPARLSSTSTGQPERRGDARKAGRWIDHVRRVYPSEADHIISWLAQRIQRPGEKVNHALVLGGSQGIGKDTILEPIKAGVGPWNWQDVSPAQMLGRFNGWAKAVVVRVNEARDLGDVDRFAFYDHSKAYIAAPARRDSRRRKEPAGALRRQRVRRHHHHQPQDRRALSARGRSAALRRVDARRPATNSTPNYWTDLYSWYATAVRPRRCAPAGARPVRVRSKGTATEDGSLLGGRAVGRGAGIGRTARRARRDGQPPPAVTTAKLVKKAEELHLIDLSDEFKDRRNRRSVPHKLERVGYVPVRNPTPRTGSSRSGPAASRVCAASAGLGSTGSAARLVT